MRILTYFSEPHLRPNVRNNLCVSVITAVAIGALVTSFFLGGNYSIALRAISGTFFLASAILIGVMIKNSRSYGIKKKMIGNKISPDNLQPVAQVKHGDMVVIARSDGTHSLAYVLDHGDQAVQNFLGIRKVKMALCQVECSEKGNKTKKVFVDDLLSPPANLE